MPLLLPPAGPHGNLSRASYFIPIQVSGPEFMLKISAPRVHADPRLCCGDQNAIHTPPGRRETKRGKAMGTIYGLIRYFNSKRFWAPLGATAILATATVAWAVPPTLVFELDGNVADDPGNTIADWNTLNGDCTVPGGG